MAELISDDPPVEGGEWPMWLPGERRLWMSERLVPHVLLPGYGIDRAKQSSPSAESSASGAADGARPAP